MTPAELARVRRCVVGFAAEVFGSLPRADQRRWGEVYLRGLMLDGKRKSIQPMAERLADGNEQALAAVRQPEPVGLAAGPPAARHPDDGGGRPGRVDRG